MTHAEATANIGQPFRLKDVGSGLIGRWDTIRSVDQHGFIEGDYFITHHEDARLKEEQPEALKKKPIQSPINTD